MAYSLAFTQSLFIVLLIAAKVQQGQFDFVPTQKISEMLDIPPSTVAAILRRLHHSGLIETREGANGGVRLAIPPSQISVLDVFTAIEQGRPLFQANSLSRVTGEKVTKVQHAIFNLLGTAEESMKQSLQSVTIQSLLETIG
jgi:Rrf2 family protein